MKQILINVIETEELLAMIETVIDKKFQELSRNNLSENGGLLSKIEVGAFLKISLPTLQEWTKLGCLKSYRIGNRVLYKQAEVEASLRERAFIKYKKEW